MNRNPAALGQYSVRIPCGVPRPSPSPAKSQRCGRATPTWLAIRAAGSRLRKKRRLSTSGSRRIYVGRPELRSGE